MVVNDEHVAIAYRLTGTHRGDYLGVPATGRRMQVRGMQIARYHEQIVARCESTDELGMLTQLTKMRPTR